MKGDQKKKRKTYGNRYDQLSNQRRILICINKGEPLSTSYLKVEDERIYRGYFDVLEKSGLICCIDENRKYTSRGYIIPIGQQGFVYELEHEHWSKALTDLRTFLAEVTAGVIVKYSSK